MTDIYEIVAVSDHTRCYSQALHQTYEFVGCRCKHDVVEGQIVGTDVRRSWTFAKGKNFFKVGEKYTEAQIKEAQITGAISAQEDINAAKQVKQKEDTK